MATNLMLEPSRNESNENNQDYLGHIKDTGTDLVFTIVNYAILTLILLIVLLPLIFIVSSSFSSPQAVMAGRVKLLPVDFSLEGYRAIFAHTKVWIGFGNSVLATRFMHPATPQARSAPGNGR